MLFLVSECATAFTCPGPDGFYRQPSNTHKFIRCVNGLPYEYACAADLVWNQSKGECDWTTGPVVPDNEAAHPSHPEVIADREARLICPAANGFFPHPNAHKFFRCVNGIDYEYICPEDLVWSQAKEQCDYARNVPTKQETSKAPKTDSHTHVHPPTTDAFVCPQADGFFACPTSTHKFIRCVAGRPFEFTCPNNLFWNIALATCSF